MAAKPFAATREMQILFGEGTAIGLTDRQLLDRFADHRDASAFEVLVRRHGPMVARVCRGAGLGADDAHDAFQATFLVLVRRAGALGKLDSLGGWLYGVACRVSARARVESARRRKIEGLAALRVVEAVEPNHTDAIDREALAPIVQEEVDRLPEKYRTAVVLCYWEGLTHEQAAAQLGCPLGTIRSRIARARDLLHRRLTRRGIAPMVVASASGLDLAAIVPPTVAVPSAWVTAAAQAAAGGNLATTVAASAPVAFLVHKTLKGMLVMKLKTTALCLMLIGSGAAGVILAAPQAAKQRPAPRARAIHRDPVRAPSTATKKVQPALQTMPDYIIEPPDLILVEVLEALPGRPISGERLVRPDGKISLGFYGEVYLAGLTIMEAKAVIVEHLRKYVNDEILGLVEIDEETNEPKYDKEGRQVLIKDFKDTDRIFVDVTAYNSKVYYVQGAVAVPGRLPITGHETVLDALNNVGGLAPDANHQGVVLYRPQPDGTLKKMPIDVDSITIGDDPSTNYQLRPGDRLVVGRTGEPAIDPTAATPDRPRPESARPAPESQPHRLTPPRSSSSPQIPEQGPTRSMLRSLESRLDAVEQKLDRILEALERREH